MSRNTRNYPQKDEESLRDTINKLKSQIRHLKKENKELKSQNETLKAAWDKTEKFLEDALSDVPLEELLRTQKLPKKALRKKEPVEPSRADIKEEVRKKWANFGKRKNDE